MNSLYMHSSLSFYKPIIDKVCSYLDTQVFQTKHMLEGISELLSNFHLKFIDIEHSFTQVFT